MKNLVEHIAKRFADHPEEVSVCEMTGKRTVILELRCNGKDVGRIIGKNGRTIGAIRALLTAFAAKERCRTVLEVVG
jgi:predicted RNA-binding protein YlqC (UPF0109 family)